MMKTRVKITLSLALCVATGLCVLWVSEHRGEPPAAGVAGRDMMPATPVPEVPPPAPLEDPEPRIVVKEVCGLSGDASFDTRLHAAHALPNDLNHSEYALIHQHVMQAAQPRGMTYRAWHVVFNDTLNALVRGQTTRIEALPSHLRALLNAPELHQVIRDYALQHLLAYSEFQMSAAERLALIHSIWPEVKTSGHSLPGTYLLAMVHAPSRAGWPTKAEISDDAWQLLHDESTHILSRITALQVCGQLGDARALPMALGIASDAQAHMSLRTAAIATIGHLGAEAETHYLRDLKTRVPQRLLGAVRAALNRLEKNHESS